jgi:predicted permease
MWARLKLKLRTLLLAPRLERELDEELDFHIEREASKLIEQGMAPHEARRTARARFGSAALMADQCRDERGTAWLTNTIRDVQYALRTFRTAPLAAATIVGTVAVGLGVVAVVFTMLNAVVFRVDVVPGVDEMYEVGRVQVEEGTGVPFTRSDAEDLRSETSVFTDTYVTIPNVDLYVNGRTMAVTLVSGNFFDVLRVHPSRGRGFTPDDDVSSAGNPVLVLSEKGWTRHFDRDPQVIGRTVLVNGATFEIVGVAPDGLRGLEVGGPDVWAPLSQLAQFRPAVAGREDVVAVEVVGRLQPGMSAERARAQLEAWQANRATDTRDDRRLAITLLPRRGTVPQPLEALAVSAPLFVVFGLILMIGCANVANLLLARGVARQKEIGIRLSLGASRGRIIRQLMTESLLLGLVAAAGGYVLSRLALEGAVHWALKTMPVDIGDVSLSVPAGDWRVAVFLVIAAVLATGVFALIPALKATAIDPVRTLRGELIRDARPGRARNVLVGVQVFASALLLICAAIFLRSALSSARFDPGFRTADTVLIDLNSEDTRQPMTRAIAQDPVVVAHAAVRPNLLAPLRTVIAHGDAGPQTVTFKAVSGGYFDVLGIPLVRGRAFESWEREHDPVAIVSESLARVLWPGRDGIGESLRLDPDDGLRAPGGLLTINPDAPLDAALTQSRIVTVVGIARDVPGLRIADVKEAGVFLPTAIDVARTTIVARVQGAPDAARQGLLERLTRIDPNLGMIITMRTVARLETFFLDMAFAVAMVLGALALVLTVSGLFSVVSYLVQQRTREIGVRMALGASAQRVTGLMLGEAARPVLVGLLAGAGLAAALAAALLATPVGGYIGQIVHLSDPVAYLSSAGIILAACLLAAAIPAARAARIDPMRTLRQD